MTLPDGPASESHQSTFLSLFSALLLPRLRGDGVKGRVLEEGGFAMEIHQQSRKQSVPRALCRL